ncbi:hypothetical protein JCM3765_004350 [Sporobolomyces pararoseus]
MHIEYLPIEIISEIAKHLRAGPFDDEKMEEAENDGKAISLVCRRWSPIGQELCWETISFEPTSLRQLVDHFISFSHIPGLVHTLVQRSIERADGGTGSDWAVKLPTLLSLTRNIRTIRIDGDFGTMFLDLLKATSSLPFLETLALFPTDSVSWNQEVDLIWEEGFESLKNFSIFIDQVDVPQSFPPVPKPPPRFLKRLEYIKIDTSILSGAEGSELFVQSLVSRVDPRSVEECDGCYYAVNRSFLSWVCECTRLERLEIEVVDEDLHESLDRVVSYLPDIKAEEIKFSTVDVSTDELSEGAIVTLPLRRVLSSIPTRLRYIQAREIAFLDHESVPLAASSKEEEENKETEYVRFEALRWTPGGFRPISFQKKLNGEDRWEKVFEKEKSWAEWDHIHP